MRQKGILITTAIAVCAIVFCVVMLVCAQQPHFAPNCTDFTVDGKTIAAIRFNEIDGLSQIQYANFVPDEFVVPVAPSAENLPRGELVELEKFMPNSAKGTYQFVVAHVNPNDDGVKENYTNGLDKFRSYDGNFHVQLFVPNVFDSAVIYVNTEIVATLGSISNYDFSEYNENYSPSVDEKHVAKTEGVYIDIEFDGGDIEKIPTGVESGKLITIHYESAQNRLGGMRGAPLIGSAEEVQSYQEGINNFYKITLVLASLELGVFTMLCILKKSVNFLPHLGVALAGMLILISRLCLNGGTAAPFLWSAIGMASTGLMALAACVSLRIKIRKFPLWTVVAGLAGVNTLLNFVMAYMPSSTFGAWHIYRVITGIVLSALLLVQSYIYVWQNPNNIYSTVTPTIAGIFTAVLPFTSTYEMLYPTSPALYLFTIMIISIFALSVWHFFNIERTNNYLTENLSGEVLRRTENLKNIVDERDRLLRYLSHDMKKPIASIKRFACELLATETNENKKASLKVIYDKVYSVDKSLLELQKYSKLNYSPEQPQKYDVYDLLKETYNELYPDCKASDIILHRDSLHVLAYYRKITLGTVLKNLIFNSIEHANCQNVYLSAEKTNDQCVITVADDGVGVEDADKMFEAYASTGDEENLGLGLYICRELVRDMGGELTYTREKDQTVFSIALPLA